MNKKARVIPASEAGREVSTSHLDVARKYSSPLILGPPLGRELVALVEHMYTEEEASLVRHLGPFAGRTASSVAASAHRTVEEVDPVLRRLALEKFVLLSMGDGDCRRYHLLPLVPGVFETALVRTSLDTLSDWHRRFAELFSKLFATGYIADYARHPVPWVRYIPVGETIESHPQALPSDRLEEVLDPYDAFAVGLCQCRMAEVIVGRGCDRPLENCVIFGGLAEVLIERGKMRRVEKAEVLEIKEEAAASGLASFVTETHMNTLSGGAACSCCGCCCGALRTISQFNAPGLIAPPHFQPHVSPAKCTRCGDCVSACPVGATVLDEQDGPCRHLCHRCIGCGLCAVACGKRGALVMEPVLEYREPPTSWVSKVAEVAPNHLRNAWAVWRKSRRGTSKASYDAADG